MSKTITGRKESMPQIQNFPLRVTADKIALTRIPELTPEQEKMAHYLICVEFGFRCHEKGRNLEATLEIAQAMLGKT